MNIYIIHSDIIHIKLYIMNKNLKLVTSSAAVIMVIGLALNATAQTSSEIIDTLESKT